MVFVVLKCQQLLPDIYLNVKFLLTVCVLVGFPCSYYSLQQLIYLSYLDIVTIVEVILDASLDPPNFLQAQA